MGSVGIGRRGGRVSGLSGHWQVRVDGLSGHWQVEGQGGWVWLVLAGRGRAVGLGGLWQAGGKVLAGGRWGAGWVLAGRGG